VSDIHFAGFVLWDILLGSVEILRITNELLMLWSSNNIKICTLLWQKNKWFSAKIFFKEAKENDFSAWRGYAFNNAPTNTSSYASFNKELYPFGHNKYLKKKTYAYQKFWRVMVNKPKQKYSNSLVLYSQAFSINFVKFKSSQDTLIILKV